MLIDSHCHLDLIPNGIEHLIENAKTQGVLAFLSVGLDLETFPALVEKTQKNSQIWLSLGLHPTTLLEQEPSIEDFLAVLDATQTTRCIAIGETGLDYHHHQGDLAWQRQRFATHIAVAKQLNKPLIIHSRAAKEDTIAVLREEGAASVGGVMHCFTEDLTTAKLAMDLNFYISFSGILTFKKAESLRALAKALPLDRILIETDSPYLAPVPHRGQPNEPSHLHWVAKALADCRGEPLDKIAEQTTENFLRCFKLTL